MKSSASRGARKLPKELAYDMLLSPNGPFVQAVQRSSVEDAAQAAVNILMVFFSFSLMRDVGEEMLLGKFGDKMHMQEVVGNLTRAGAPAGASSSSMLSALIAVGDEVILKSENRGSGSMVGTVNDSVMSKGSLRPVYRVRCASVGSHSSVFRLMLRDSSVAM